jgi:hypothetical protein
VFLLRKKKMTTLVCEHEKQVLPAIQGWAANRFPHLNVDNHVAYYKVDKHETCVSIDMSIFDPYSQQFLLFYTWTASICRIDILGGIEAHNVIRHHGKIDLTLDIYLDGLNPHPICLNMEIDEENDDNGNCCWFWVPIAELPRNKGNSNFLATCSYDDLQQRLAWYMNCGAKYAPVPENFANNQDAELGAFLYTGLVGDALSHVNNGASQQLFFQLRSILERRRYEKLFAPFQVSEARLIELLVLNDLYDYMEEAMMVDATPLDRQLFYVRHSTDTPPPSVVFRVLLEDVPSELALHLPLYTHGLVHLTYKDIFPWMWQCLETQQLKMQCATVNKLYDERILKDAQHVDAFIQNNLSWIRRKAQETFKIRIIESQYMAPSGEEATDVDKAGLLNAMPLCFRNVMTQKSFMKHQQRWPWLLTLRKAGVSKQSAVEWLEHMNELYPHQTHNYATLKARFDYDRLWDYKKDDACYCGNMVRSAVQQNQNEIQCPYVHEQALDIEDMLGTVKLACARSRNDTRYFSGPADVISRNLVKTVSAESVV